MSNDGHLRRVIADLERELEQLRPLATDGARPLIVANLSDEDYDRMLEARIPYSGATGKGISCGYEPYGPYIATYLQELSRVVDVLGGRVQVMHKGHAWIVRRERRR